MAKGGARQGSGRPSEKSQVKLKGEQVPPKKPDDLNGEPYRANRHGVCEFSIEDGAAFTPYEALTEQQVLGWVWAKDSKEVVENWIAEAVAAQKNPPAVARPLPWE